MKHWICTILIVFGVVGLAFDPTRVVAGTGGGTLTGAANGPFASGATLGTVALESVDVGTGVFVEPDGTASGVFHAVLTGRALDSSRQITIEGKPIDGTIGADGGVTLNGVATVDLGDGTPTISGVPFSINLAGGSLVLTVNSTTLPAAALTGGSVTVE